MKNRTKVVAALTFALGGKGYRVDIRRSSEEVIIIPRGIPRRFYPAILPLPLSR